VIAVDIDQSLESAAEFLEAGRLDEAEATCRQIIAIEPDAYALYFLGLIEQRRGRHERAVVWLSRAAGGEDTDAEFLHALGVSLFALGRCDEAAGALKRAAALQPDSAAIQFALGAALARAGRQDDATDAFSTVVRLRPELAEAHYNLGTVLAARERLPEAVAALTRAIDLKPDFADAHCALGAALKRQGTLDEAAAALQRALEIKPDHLDALCNLGLTRQDQKRLVEAAETFARAIELKPDLADAWCSLGMVLQDQRKLDEAIAAFERAIRIDPRCGGAHNNLGVSLKDQGRLDEALASFEREVALHPDDAAMHSNVAYSVHYHPGYDAAALLREQCRWAALHAEPLKRQIRPHADDRSPDRRLRIGYVSPDFSLAPVGRFLLPLLEQHDHGQFEIFAYSDVRAPDAMTRAIRPQVDTWRDLVGVPDEPVAELIRSDGIDILVDLCMHMARNRMLVFARKPAPVQVTYLAYVSTTGVDAIDYRLTDPYLDPPGSDDARYTERSVRLPETYWCYRPGIQTPEVNPLPAPAAGHVTFGCLNNFCKVTEPTLEAWGRLLGAVPRSRLILFTYEGSHRARLLEMLARQGVEPERVTLVGFQPGHEYFQTYQRIDIALDPFPYGGGTTSCDALWMGVPVVSLAGETGVSRGGLSLLSNVGSAELVAQSTEQYVRIAADLAGDVKRLSELRSGLRERMRRSPLMDAPRFARNVEAAYRKMWTERCSK
jgi:protein O-GlcNAc transferase